MRGTIAKILFFICSKGRFERAKRKFKTCVRINSEDVDSLYHLAILERKDGAYLYARFNLETIISNGFFLHFFFRN